MTIYRRQLSEASLAWKRVASQTDKRKNKRLDTQNFVFCIVFCIVFEVVALSQEQRPDQLLPGLKIRSSTQSNRLTGSGNFAFRSIKQFVSFLSADSEFNADHKQDDTRNVADTVKIVCRGHHRPRAPSATIVVVVMTQSAKYFRRFSLMTLTHTHELLDGCPSVCNLVEGGMKRRRKKRRGKKRKKKRRRRRRRRKKRKTGKRRRKTKRSSCF